MRLLDHNEETINLKGDNYDTMSIDNNSSCTISDSNVML